MMIDGFNNTDFSKVLDYLADGRKDYQLAKEIGVSPSTLSKWRNGFTQPGISDLIRISKIYGMPIEELLNISPIKVSEVANTLTPRKICREIAAIDNCIGVGITENPDNGRLYITFGAEGQISDEIQLFLRMLYALRETSRKQYGTIRTREQYMAMVDKLLEGVSNEPLKPKHTLFLDDPITADEPE